VSNNLVSSDALFMDPTNADMARRNYQLKSTITTAIDKGIGVAPYDDAIADGPDDDTIAQPDLGAYEYGVAPWAAGAGQASVPSSWVVSGVAYRDGNRNNTRDADEPKLANRSIYIDVNGNGTYDMGTVRSFTATDTPKPIPDYNNTTGTPGVATSVINVPANSGVVSGMTVTINIDHTYDGDLIGYLIAPDGTSIKLMERVGGGNDHFINTIFDDAAAIAISSGSAPFNGTYRPTMALAAMNGKNAAGVWTLRVEDRAGSSIGTLKGFSIQYGRAGDIATTTAADGSYAFYNFASATTPCVR
jgi:subtilisin-like proprotein convertase family protein